MKVFLTGASSGIGEALARHYAARGATLGLVARRSDLLARLRDSLPTPAETYAVNRRGGRFERLTDPFQPVSRREVSAS